jgi:acetyl esterase/lipase
MASAWLESLRHGAITALVALFACGSAFAHDDVSPAELNIAKPGTVLRIWPLEGGVFAGYKGYRVLYRSTGMKDEPIAVTGAVIFPTDGGHGRSHPVVAWAHPTTGVVNRCAPSLLPDLSTTIQGIDRFVDAGYVVVAADYAGLGAPGTHPYLVGKSAARTVLDSVRAARFLKDTHAGERFVVWGHSQGGHAALFTGAEAASYAPELKLLGVAAAAPATNLIDLFESDRTTSSGRSLTVMALHSWSRVFDVPLSEFVAPQAERSFERLANDCIETIEGFLKEDDDERALSRQFLAADPAKDARIRAIMEANSTGLLPAGMPVFVAQGTADDLVRPAITRAYVEKLCKGGAKVKMHAMAGVGHLTAGRDGANAAFDWMQGLFEGRVPPHDC